MCLENATISILYNISAITVNKDVCSHACMYSTQWPWRQTPIPRTIAGLLNLSIIIVSYYPSFRTTLALRASDWGLFAVTYLFRLVAEKSMGTAANSSTLPICSVYIRNTHKAWKSQLRWLRWYLEFSSETSVVDVGGLNWLRQTTPPPRRSTIRDFEF